MSMQTPVLRLQTFSTVGMNAVGPDRRLYYVEEVMVIF